jgi:uncharacterized surface protein with fasciclin (FAS1) repeats
MSAVLAGCAAEEEVEDEVLTDDVEETMDTGMPTDPETPGDDEGDADDQEAQNETLVTFLTSRDDMSTLVDLAGQAEMVDVLSETSGVTLFAPTDEAFGNLDPETLEAVTSDPKLLRNVLAAHVAMGTLRADNLIEDGEFSVEDQAGTTFMVTQDGEAVMLGDAQVLEPNIEVGGNVVHVIDAVLVPDVSTFDPDQTPGMGQVGLWYLETE